MRTDPEDVLENLVHLKIACNLEVINLNSTDNGHQYAKPSETMEDHCVQYELTTYHGKDVIFIRFEYDRALIERVKKLVGVKWCSSEKAWYVLDSALYREKFGLGPKTLTGKTVLLNIHPVNQPALQRYIETLQLKAYSPNTIKTYQNEFAQLLYVLKETTVDTLDETKLRSYFLYCINTLKLSENTLHSRINAVKFYFEQVLRRKPPSNPIFFLALYVPIVFCPFTGHQVFHIMYIPGW